MNLIVSITPFFPELYAHLCTGNALWANCNPRRKAATASTVAHQGPERVRSRTHEAGAEREEAHSRYQEERESRSIGTRKRERLHAQHNLILVFRMLAKSWRRILLGPADMFTSSIRCERSFRPSACASRHSEVISKWLKQCAVPLECVYQSFYNF